MAKLNANKIKEKIENKALEEKWSDAMENLGNMTKKAKKKYDEIDSSTKREVLAAAIGVAATLAVVLGVKKVSDKYKARGRNSD